MDLPCFHTASFALLLAAAHLIAALHHQRALQGGCTAVKASVHTGSYGPEVPSFQTPQRQESPQSCPVYWDHFKRHSSGQPPSRRPRGFCLESQRALSGRFIAASSAFFDGLPEFFTKSFGKFVISRGCDGEMSELCLCVFGFPLRSLGRTT